VVELPRGTVTFLFTDIEGSTRLVKDLGDRYSDVLAEHRLILREAVAAREGREIDTQGDSFFFAFPRANAALGAAVTAQRALAEQQWPEGGEVRVRMGLHTAEPAVGVERYVGLGVHRAARIGAIAHGGQVLLSSSTRELVEDEVGGVSVRDLGSYRLKDIDRPERLFQLDIEGLQTDFPPLRAEKVAARRPRRRAILLGGLAGVIAAAAAIPIFVFGQGGAREALHAAVGNSVGLVDAGSGRLVGDIGVGATPTRVAVGEGAYWVTNADDATVSRADPGTKAVQTITVGNGPSGIAVGNAAVWVANGLDGTVSRIDPAVNRVVQQIDVGNRPVGVVYAAGSIWVANTGDGTITRIHANSGRPARPLPIAATELAFGAGSLWASERELSKVVRIDAKTEKITQAITVGNGPAGIAFGSGAVWVANSLDGTVSRIDPVTNSVAAVISTGNGPTSVAVDAHGVWVSNQFGGTLVRIDPTTNQKARFSVGNRPQGVAIGGGNVLVAVRAAGAGHRGGRLTVRMDSSGLFDAIDSAIAYSPASWPIVRITGDGLVAYNQVSGPAGTQLVPDLAVSLPTPTAGGKTYTFRLRPNIRYSNGGRLKASDVRSTFERNFELGTPTQYYDGIVGAAHCAKKGEQCDLSRGIVTDDAVRTVTFRLTAADPEFLYKLALPFAYVVPARSPVRAAGTHPLPATGPYRIAGYRPRHILRLVRNRYFHEWSQAAQPDGYPDEIVVRFGGTADEAIRDAITGKADVASTWWAGTFPSARLLEAIKTRHASQVHTNPGSATLFLALNTRVAPFNRLDVRRALNYAADRAAAVQVAGGADQAQATCQILPPNFPGYRPYCPYTAAARKPGEWTTPDLAKARALVARSGTRGMRVTVWSWTGASGFGPYAVKLLRSLGYRPALKVLGDTYFSTTLNSRTKAQIAFNGWYADYPAASNFFSPLFSCASFVPEDGDKNSNAAEFCDSRVDRVIRQALSEQAANPAAPRALWERLDRQVVDQAPWVPLVNPKGIDVLAKRVGNYQYSPAGFGMLLDQLWVR
jgi:YVTN family beta-propeller protein